MSKKCVNLYVTLRLNLHIFKDVSKTSLGRLNKDVL